MEHPTDLPLDSQSLPTPQTTQEGKPLPGRVTKSGKYRLVELKDADLTKVDWSRAGEELPREDLLEIIELMKEGEDEAQVEKEYLEMLNNMDKLVSFEDLLKELEADDQARTR